MSISEKYRRPLSDAAHHARRLIRAYDIFSAIRYLFADDVTNEDGMVDDLEMLAGVGASDHAVICFNYTCYIPLVEGDSPRPNVFKGDYSAMRESLQNHQWDLENGDNVDDMWSKFSSKLDSLVREYVPEKK